MSEGSREFYKLPSISLFFLFPFFLHLLQVENTTVDL